MILQTLNVFQTIFKDWKNDNTTVSAVLGFPPVGLHFNINISKIITYDFGNFILDIKHKFKRNNELKRNFLSSNQSVIGSKVVSKNMKGRYALILWDDSKMDLKDFREIYVYALCTGSEDDPLAFYFKWPQYVDERDQLDETPYPDSEWSIVWLSRKLSDEELRVLDREGYIPGLTPPVRKL